MLPTTTATTSSSTVATQVGSGSNRSSLRQSKQECSSVESLGKSPKSRLCVRVCAWEVICPITKDIIIIYTNCRPSSALTLQRRKLLWWPFWLHRFVRSCVGAQHHHIRLSSALINQSLIYIRTLSCTIYPDSLSNVHVLLMKLNTKMVLWRAQVIPNKNHQESLGERNQLMMSSRFCRTRVSVEPQCSLLIHFLCTYIKLRNPATYRLKGYS